MVKLIKDITDDFFETLGRWQSLRPLWLTGGLAALVMEIFSVLYFQVFLGLFPCEYCVKIRFAMIVIFFGAMVAAINPKFVVFKLFGYAVSIGAAVWGLSMSVSLEIINLKVLHSGFIPPCSLKGVVFPLGLKLDDWFPSHFAPQGMCGEGPQWFFLGFSMTQWLILVYSVMICGLALMFLSWLVFAVKARKGPGPKLGGLEIFEEEKARKC
ncbi:MAG: disulfide bond formation protein B [Deltaproteobacteria bacterium]|jgi:disulfide bond formation protein DsbB|nr:disulfide bond formation protein B [Deltaproteobacteria bacterium]